MRQKMSRAFKHQVLAGALLFAATFFLPPVNQSSFYRAKDSQPQPDLKNIRQYNQPFSYQALTFLAASPTPSPAPVLTPTPGHSSTPTPTVTIAQVRTSKTRQLPQSSFDQLFSQYAADYGVDEQLLKRISYCESRFNPQAVSGPYGGLFQFSQSTWVRERNRHGWDPDPYLRFNAEEAIKTAAVKIASGGIRAWPNCGK